MTAAPERRFARLRHTNTRHSSTTTLLAAAPHQAPDPTNHGLLADLAARDPSRANLIQEKLRILIARDATVMTWLEADPANLKHFLSDPAAALHRALPDLTDDFFTGWSVTPQA